MIRLASHGPGQSVGGDVGGMEAELRTGRAWVVDQECPSAKVSCLVMVHVVISELGIVCHFIGGERGVGAARGKCNGCGEEGGGRNLPPTTVGCCGTTVVSPLRRFGWSFLTGSLLVQEKQAPVLHCAVWGGCFGVCSAAGSSVNPVLHRQAQFCCCTAE